MLEKQERIKQLEEELEQMREDIRRVTEDQEAANEELQSTNEELLSNSEELQTLNEKLETSAEELLSSNEELLTVNDELMDRQEQLTMARMYSEAIVETVRGPLIVIDRDMKVVSANDAYYKFFRTSHIDVEGKLIFDVNTKQWNIKALSDKLKDLLHNKTKIEDYEMTVYSPELGERTMLLSARQIKNETTIEQLILLALEDITLIKKANAMLLQNNRQLEENNKELSSFSYIASHDLQEPLRKIYTFGKLITESEENISDTSKMYLDRILVSTTRMQQLIDDLLTYSHLNNIKDADFSDTDLSMIISEVLSDLEEDIEKKDAKIIVGELPLVKARPSLLHQLFINLVGNAIKYVKPDTPPLVHISWETVSGREVALLGGETDKPYHKIQVKDNGIGFRQEQSGIIFEPFKRLHSKDKFEGSGIGLAICTKIVIKHRGFINAKSTPGEGTTFNIYLPID